MARPAYPCLRAEILAVVLISLMSQGLALADSTQDPGYCTTVACRVDEQGSTHACNTDER
jgi:hypothetical protein